MLIEGIPAILLPPAGCGFNYSQDIKQYDGTIQNYCQTQLNFMLLQI